MDILAQLPGMFGTLSVVQTDWARRIAIEQQNQGGSFLEPALVTERGPVSPGPVFEASYMTGWLLAGTQNQTGRGLMIGLGSGAGAIGLLHCFPGIDLTVVEIDPQMVALATQHFPLIDHFQDLGRLQIVRADANQFLQDAAGRGESWDFLVGDAFTGTNHHHCPDDLLHLMTICSQSLWFNVIDNIGGRDLDGLVAKLQRLDRPCQAFDFRPETPPNVARNLLVTTQPIDPQVADEFEPFQDLDHPNVDQVRAQYRSLLASSVSLQSV